MNIPKPMTVKNYNKTVSKIIDSVNVVDVVYQRYWDKKNLSVSGITKYEWEPGSETCILEVSKDTKLEKCLHGKTWNANESFNGRIWERIPKNTFVTLPNFESLHYWNESFSINLWET